MLPARTSTEAVVARLATVLLILAIGALGIWFVLHGKLNADEGFYLLASQFIVDGLRPFRDFGFTQTPLVPYANVPWLALFGFDLMGVRLAGLAWAMAVTVLGVVTLQRRYAWRVTFAFTLLLSGSPVWLAFATKGKTYAFSSLAILLGTIALATPGGYGRRWALFTVASAIGIAARLPAAAFFLPAGVALLILTPGWRSRMFAVGAIGGVAAITLYLAAAGSWSEFWFWAFKFHAESTIRPDFWARLLELFALAPALWMALTIFFLNPLPRDARLALLSLIVAVLINVLPPSGYAEYATAFVPALCWTVAPIVAAHVGRLRYPRGVGATVAVLALGWISPPPLDRNVLIDASKASAFLNVHTAPPDHIVASMPEIAVAAARVVPTELAMGKFAVTESLSQAEADAHRMLTPSALVALLEKPTTTAVVLSTFKRWNYSWSVPDYHYLSGPSRTKIFQTIERDYAFAYGNAEYLIFLRKRHDDQADHSRPPPSGSP